MRLHNVLKITSVVLITTTLNNYAVASPIGNVEWCLKSADKKIKDQPMGANNANCLGWVVKYGFRNQHELAWEAVSLAKGGDVAGAMERLNVCQCHNGEAQAEMNAHQSEVIDYLKKQ